MLTIRSAQFNQLELPQWKALERQIVAIIRKDFAALANDFHDDHGLETLVSRAVETARNYRLRRRVDLLSFAVLAASYGTDFYLHPAVSWVLTDPALSGDRKIPFLLSETSPAQWQQIAAAAVTTR